MRTRAQKVLFVVLIVGGLAVLASYAHGYLTHADNRWAIWGGIPPELRPVYVVSMLLAAAGFFPMTTLFLLRVDSGGAFIAGRLGYGFVFACYVAVLGGSAAWMPLTYAMIATPSDGVWLAIRLVLGAVALGSLGLAFSLVALNQKAPVRWHRLAVAGSLFFCWQTAVLDALVWTHYFPM